MTDIHSMSDAELDACVAREVMGWVVIDGDICKMLPESRPPNLLITEDRSYFHPSTDWRDAGQVLCQIVFTGHSFRLLTDGNGSWTLTSEVNPTYDDTSLLPYTCVASDKFASTPTRAICESALKAVRAKGGTNE